MDAMRELRPAYGFDDVAIVPGDVTINPELTDIGFSLGELTFPLPVVASAMDAVVDVQLAAALSRLGGLAVMNLEGVQTRYDDPDAVLAEIAAAPDDQATALIQEAYSRPIQERLAGERVRQLKAAGAVCAVSATPANTKRLAPLAVEAGPMSSWCSQR
ncbi:MAG: IMP dehydrogenase [Dehalococcoidia bacterium]